MSNDVLKLYSLDHLKQTCYFMNLLQKNVFQSNVWEFVALSVASLCVNLLSLCRYQALLNMRYQVMTFSG